MRVIAPSQNQQSFDEIIAVATEAKQKKNLDDVADWKERYDLIKCKSDDIDT